MIEEKIKNRTIIPLGFDRCFKKIFGDNDAIERVEAFLAEYLNIPYEDIKGKVTILNEEKRVATKNSKRGAVDVIADLNLDDDRKRVNIELNFFHKSLKRNIVYVCNFVSSSIRNKESYEKMPKILQINFDKFEIDERNPRIVKRYYLRDEGNRILDEGIEIDHVNIVKCYEVCYNQCIERIDYKDRKIIQLGALLYASSMEELEKCLSVMEMEEKIKSEIVDAVEEYNEDEFERMFYDEEEDKRMIQNDEIIIAKREAIAEGRAEGRVEGRAEGHADGLAKGLKEGHKMGHKEGVTEARISIAKNLLNMNMLIEDISKATGLSKEELEKIKTI